MDFCMYIRLNSDDDDDGATAKQGA